MPDPTNRLAARRRQPRRARGFSFTEVLFAVMILGIGFIMIAAIFPVSLSQVSATNSETTGASVARGATLSLQSVADGPAARNVFQVTLQPAQIVAPAGIPVGQSRTLYGEAWSMRDSRMTPAHRAVAWGAVAGNMIIPTDPRMAWVAAYRRDLVFRNTGAGVVPQLSEYAQVIVASVQSRNTPNFSREPDLEPPAATAPINLTFRQGNATLIAPTPNAPGPDTPGHITFRRANAAETEAADAVVEGGYVIIGGQPDPSPDRRNWMSGRVYRIGVRDAANPNRYGMVPGAEFKKDPGIDGVLLTADDVLELRDVPVLVIGKGYTYPAGSPPQLEGPAMDISVYTTFVRVR